MLRIVFNIIFYCAIAFLVLFLWTITAGQSLSIEFRDTAIRNSFYDALFMGTPLAVLLTLFGSIRKAHARAQKIATIILTVLVAVGSFFFIISIMFEVGFGVWSTFNVAFVKKENPAIQIREQRYDVGALGYGGQRVVEVRPFLWLFWKISPVDLAAIDKTQWVLVDKEEIKSP